MFFFKKNTASYQRQRRQLRVLCCPRVLHSNHVERNNVKVFAVYINARMQILKKIQIFLIFFEIIVKICIVLISASAAISGNKFDNEPFS